MPEKEEKRESPIERSTSSVQDKLLNVTHRWFVRQRKQRVSRKPYLISMEVQYIVAE